MDNFKVVKVYSPMKSHEERQRIEALYKVIIEYPLKEEWEKKRLDGGD